VHVRIARAKDLSKILAARLRGRAFVAILTLTAASAVLFWSVAPPTYLTNDDVAIKRDLEGLIAPDGVPTGYAIWPHALLGWALVYVQRLIPIHAWDVVVAALIICAAALVLTEAWSLATDSSGRFLSTAAALIVIIPLFDGMQYSMSATLAAVAGALAMIMELSSQRPRRFVLAASAALLVLGLLVRSDSATAGGLMMVGVLVPLGVSSREMRAVYLRALLIAAATLGAAAVALDLLNDGMYRLSPAWAAYRFDWLATRRLLEWGSDLPDDVVSALRARVGWTANDWELLRRFWGIDPTIHSQSRMDALFQLWPHLMDFRTRAMLLMQRGAAEVTGGGFLHLFSESWMTVAAAAALVYRTADRRGTATAVAATTIFYVACAALEVLFKELPFRLFAPLQVCLILSILLTCRTLARPASRMNAIIGGAVLMGLVIGQAFLAGADAAANARQANDVDAQVADLLQLHPSMLVLHGDSFPSEFWWRPFHTPTVGLRAVALGNENHNPYLQRFLAASYRPSLLYAICTDPSILVVGDYDRLAPVTSYMREHFGSHVTWTNVYQGSFGAWRCSPVSQEAHGDKVGTGTNLRR